VYTIKEKYRHNAAMPQPSILQAPCVCVFEIKDNYRHKKRKKYRHNAAMPQPSSLQAPCLPAPPPLPHSRLLLLSPPLPLLLPR